MSNRGQVWDHKSLLKPKSFCKSPPDRIFVPDYKFMVAIINRIVSYYYGSFHFFLKNCIFLENRVKYSLIHWTSDSLVYTLNQNGSLMQWIRLYFNMERSSDDFVQTDEAKRDNRFFLLFGPFRDTICPIIILQSMIRDNHGTWLKS